MPVEPFRLKEFASTLVTVKAPLAAPVIEYLDHDVADIW